MRFIDINTEAVSGGCYDRANRSNLFTARGEGGQSARKRAQQRRASGDNNGEGTFKIVWGDDKSCFQSHQLLQCCPDKPDL